MATQPIQRRVRRPSHQPAATTAAHAAPQNSTGGHAAASPNQLRPNESSLARPALGATVVATGAVVLATAVVAVAVPGSSAGSAVTGGLGGGVAATTGDELAGSNSPVTM